MHAPNLSLPLTQKAFLLLYGVLKLNLRLILKQFSPSFCTKIPIRFVDHLMDINHQKFTNPTWDPNITMEDLHFRHDHQFRFDHTIWTDYPLQNHCTPSSSPTPLQAPNLLSTQMANLKKQEEEEEPEEELGALKEMMFKIAAMQPVDIDPATIRKPKRQNVRISNDPQSVAARHRREKISEKMRILQRLVPGGTKMDTASMLDEAIRYVKFLKRQIRLLQANHNPQSIGAATTTSTEDWLAVTMGKAPGSATTSGATIAGTSYTFGGNGGYGIPFCLSNRQF